MNTHRDPGQDERYSIARSANLAARGIYGSWSIWLGLAYTFAALMFIAHFDAPVARAIGLPGGNIEALLVDMAILMVAPMTAIMWWHIRKVSADRRRIKEVFLSGQDMANLLAARHNRQLVYEIINRSRDDGRIEVRLVWNGDGPVRDGGSYIHEPQAFAPFDRETFLNH